MQSILRREHLYAITTKYLIPAAFLGRQLPVPVDDMLLRSLTDVYDPTRNT